ncbi:HD domain-containing protein [Clostridium sp.]|uniref:HD domain-containing protein n=1 Tax=Clostridium sp. TaxID=1506 RepID=UPI003463E26D
MLINKISNIKQLIANKLNKNNPNFNDVKINELNDLSSKLWYKSTCNYARKVKLPLSSEISKTALLIDAMRYRQYHSQQVADIALKLFDNNITTFKKEFTEIDYTRKILYFSCLIHDIKKFNEPHNKNGAEWFQKNIKNFCHLDDSALFQIYTIILHHNGKLKMDEKIDNTLKLLILTMRIADKLSKLQEKSNYKKISNDAIEITIKKVLKNSKNYLPKNFNSPENFYEFIKTDFYFEKGALI